MMIELLAQDGFFSRLFRPDSEQPGELRWQWMNLPESWGVFVWLAIIAAVVFGAVWLYRKEMTTCPFRIRMLLAGIRVLILLALLLMLFKPSVYFQKIDELRPTFALLRDSSISIAASDFYHDEKQVEELAKLTGTAAKEISERKVTRADLINRALTANQYQFFQDVRKKGSLRVIDFSDQVNPVGLLPNIPLEDQKKSPADSVPSSENEIPLLQANGLGTDIWQALRQTISDTKQLAGIIIVSDGQQVGSESPLEIAAKARAEDIPIFVVGVGDPTPERNLSVMNVNAPARAYMNEPLFIEGILQVSLAEDDPVRQSPVNVSLYQQTLDVRTGKAGEAKLVETKPLVLDPQTNRFRAQFTHVVSEAGSFIYSVAAGQIENETNANDNLKVSAPVEVVDEKVRVLLISGLPNWDFQQLHRLLQRDSTISVSCWLQSLDETRLQEGDEPISDLPRTLEELGEYNAIIMIDPNPEEFDEAWINLLKEFCRTKAGGLVYMAGPQYSGEFFTMNRLAGIKEILPVRFGDANSIAASQVIAEATGDKLGGMQIINHNLEHPMMKVAEDNAEVQRIWNQMPGFQWNFPTVARKPTARVLIERGDQPGLEGNQPMLVDGKFGSGTVVYFGFQGTWRWRSVGLQAQYFNNFWIQTVRFLVEHRSLQGSRRGYVDSEKVEYELGSRVLLLADIVDEQFKPLEAESVNLILQDEDGRIQKLAMRLVPDKMGKYEVAFNAARIGRFEARIDLGNEGSDKLFEPASFAVTPPRAETTATWLNEKLLRDIAEQSGGAYVPLERLESVAGLLPDIQLPPAEFNSPPKPFWDLNSLIRNSSLLLMVLLLTTEWAIRKWHKLL